jgi:hypothetical protein
MTLEELKNKLTFLNDINTPISLSMYILKKDGTIRFTNLEESVRSEIKEKFISYLNYRVNDEEVNYCNLTEYVDRRNTICHYDLSEVSPELINLSIITENENQQEFSFENEKFSDIDAFLFLIGNENNKIAIYKNQFAVSLIKRNGTFIPLKKSKTELVKLESDILKINESFEFLQVDNELIVMNIKTLENSFGYLGILIREANAKLELIRSASIIDNIEEFEEFIQEKKYAKKLVQINATTPVLGLPFETLKNFITGHPKLKKRIKFNDASDKIRFHSNVSKELFLKLLSDSYLKSELTELLYESDSKAELTGEEEEDE